MFTTANKTIIISVINDLVTDQRVLRSARTLKKMNYEVFLVGRYLKNSLDEQHIPFKSKRFKMFFKKGPLFYFFFNLRLFFFLLFKKSDLYLSNDLDTLLPNYLIAKLKNKKLIYDSHEIFCEVPELKSSPIKKKIWELLEKKIVPQLKNCITVNSSIASYFKTKYSVNFEIIRNIAEPSINAEIKSKQELGIPINQRILILQGAGINMDRGAEELVEAMQFVEGTHLFIIGGGDVFQKLEKLISNLNLSTKVTIKTKMPKSELMQYTLNADIGICIDKPTNLNYTLSLPNKFFDYTQAHLAILASRLPEIEKLISQYDLGTFIENHEPRHIAKVISEMISGEQLIKWKSNTKKMNIEHNWNLEQEKLFQFLKSLK